MTTRSFTNIVALATLLSILGLTPGAHAIEKCRVKVDRKTGVLRVDASGLTGPVTWGPTADTATQSFFNAATCVTPSKATRCEIGDPSTLAAKTPPRGCTLYLSDGGAPCSAWIGGCSPAPREAAGLLWRDSNGQLIGISESAANAVVIHSGSEYFAVPVKPGGNGFDINAAFRFTSFDCSGPRLVGPNPNTIQYVYTVASDGIAYYPADAGSLTSYNSYAFSNAAFVDQDACSANVPTSTYQAPFTCCVEGSGSEMLSAVATLDLTGFSAPFHLDPQ